MAPVADILTKISTCMAKGLMNRKNICARFKYNKFDYKFDIKVFNQMNLKIMANGILYDNTEIGTVLYALINEEN